MKIFKFPSMLMFSAEIDKFRPKVCQENSKPSSLSL